MISFFAGLAPCTVGMEACATAHFWARELKALGHNVRLMPWNWKAERLAAAVNA
jgi:transposase